MEIKVLARQGQSIKAIARESGLSRNTVRKYLRSGGSPRYTPRDPRPIKLDPYKAYLQARIEAARPHWIPATVLLREIQARGYPGGISQLKAFVATLGYSRATFVRFSERENSAAWLAGLEAAFAYFGGVPQEALFDNAGAIITERDAFGDGRHRWHPALAELAETYGFRPRVCRPYRAQTKGKVERFNGYLKGSFVTPLAATLNSAGLRLVVATANAHIGRWIEEIAHQRIHGTTGVKPATRLAQERLELRPVPVRQHSPAPAPSLRPGRTLPHESLQHPLSVYDQLLQVRA